jgi:hypothetical protein
VIMTPSWNCQLPARTMVFCVSQVR